MTIYYANLKHGDRFKVPGYDTIYVRVRGGYRNVDEKNLNRILKTGLTLGSIGPVKDRMTEVTLVAVPVQPASTEAPQGTAVVEAFTAKQEAVQQVQTMLWTDYGINISTEQAMKLVDIGIRVAEARDKKGD